MLTVLGIEKLKPNEKSYKVSDGNGLYVLVEPSGGKLWRFRFKFGGKEKMLSLGSFPAVSLADARRSRDEAQKLLAKGINPSDQKKQEKLVAEVAGRNTFLAVAEEHIQRLKDQKLAHATINKNRWLLIELASPLHHRPVSQIKPAEILVILQKYEKAGMRETARRLRGAIGAVFRLAIATLRAETDPTYSLRDALAAPIVTHRAAITDEKQLGILMVNLDQYDGWPTLKYAIQFLALTMVRPGEVRHMRRNEVIWPASTWRIPAERMKMRKPHDVPLSKQALAILRDVWPLTEGENLVFPSIRSIRRPLSENAFNSVLRRMGYGSEEHCAHGFRSSASTILNERGYDDDVIEVALAHEEPNKVRRAYNRAAYWPERVKLLQDWADLLDEFR
ncbi:MAG: integrase arm-type DNA-binding domain-containing protein, partial [Xanthobacteraceae bacterium]